MSAIKSIIKVLILSFSIALLAGACQQKTKDDAYTINGTIKGIEEGWVKLIESNYGDRSAKASIIDSTQILNGTFEFKGKVEHADQIQMKIGDDYYTNFILENCEISLELELTRDESGRSYVSAEINGSELNDILARVDAKSDSIFKNKKYAILEEIRDESIKAYRSKDPELIEKANERSKQYAELSDERFYEYKNAKIEYAKANPGSTVAPYVLGFMFSEGRMTREEMKEIYPIFEGEAKNTAMYAYYTKTYEEIFNKLGEGSPAPDFTLPALDGGTLTLSEVKGKYIFLDFWASWCQPCRESFPHLKKVFDKYHNDGFEVIAVGTADAGANWKKAIEEDKTVWNHVFDGDPDEEGKGKGQYGEVSQLYAVPFLPTTFLIDEKGIIVARQLRGKDLDKKLEELFGY